MVITYICFFFPRWKEASGVDTACASCYSGSTSSAITGPGKATSSTGTSVGAAPAPIYPPIYSGRKTRDVSHSESMLNQKYFISYKRNIAVNILQCLLKDYVILSLW